MNPLAHYLEHGAYEDRKPNPLFDSLYYRNKYKDVLEPGVNPLVDYLEHGVHEDRNPNPLFDTAYYLKQYPDVVTIGFNPLTHYLEYGAQDGRNPHPLFDTAYYLIHVPGGESSPVWTRCPITLNREPWKAEIRTPSLIRSII